MKPEIKLPDPEYCNGCPLLIAGFCKITGQRVSEKVDKRGWVKFKNGEPLRPRPQICKDKNGE